MDGVLSHWENLPRMVSTEIKIKRSNPYNGIELKVTRADQTHLLALVMLKNVYLNHGDQKVISI